MDLACRCGRLAALLTGEVALVALLHWMGSLPWFALPSGDLLAWLRLTRPEDALAATVRLVGLVGACWLLGSTVLYLAARASHLPGALALADWLTLPAVRRIADRAVAVSLTTSSLLGTAAQAAEPPPVPVPVVVASDDATTAWPPLPDYVPGPDAPPTEQQDQQLPEPQGQADADPAADPVGRDSQPAPPVAVQREIHHVQPGDHLWSIATRRLADARPDQPLGAGDIAPYWRRVVDVNAPRIRSGDADLIFPGEEVLLPDPDTDQEGAGR